jgi:3-phenylpropionate/trans-cinnamate dioxygenase ferredoxin reductase component
METVIVIGGGHAGGDAALAIRQSGFQGKIILVSQESILPYHRPPLSKKFLAGDVGADTLGIKPAGNYEKADIEFLPDTAVRSIERAEKRIITDNSSLSYDYLVIATGSRARSLEHPDLPDQINNLLYLRDLSDSKKLQDQLAPGKHLVIIGGGYIGLEVAATAINKGVAVTVLEQQERVLSRVTSPEVSRFYEKIHTDAGARVITGVAIKTYKLDTAGAKIVSLELNNGETLQLDTVLAGVGAAPRTELAEEAGLDIDNGILVNEFCQTSDPSIYAIGDCSNHYNPIYGRRVRLESVPNAVEQARIAAKAICGSPSPYAPVPWFWSDQYDLKLQMAGLSQGYDQCVVRGEMTEASFVAFYLKSGKVLAADCVNRQPEFVAIKKLVQQQAEVSQEALRSPETSLKELAQSVSSGGT